ncbi:MAG TPA: hypothetical protein VGP47_08365 [Parachlamydiaceae bacterium]|nr:hypothetical protein [Parachlamydiaceae bacterium]
MNIRNDNSSNPNFFERVKNNADQVVNYIKTGEQLGGKVMPEGASKYERMKCMSHFPQAIYNKKDGKELSILKVIANGVFFGFNLAFPPFLGAHALTMAVIKHISKADEKNQLQLKASTEGLLKENFVKELVLEGKVIQFENEIQEYKNYMKEMQIEPEDYEISTVEQNVKLDSLKQRLEENKIDTKKNEAQLDKINEKLGTPIFNEVNEAYISKREEINNGLRTGKLGEYNEFALNSNQITLRLDDNTATGLKRKLLMVTELHLKKLDMLINDSTLSNTPTDKIVTEKLKAEKEAISILRDRDENILNKAVLEILKNKITEEIEQSEKKLPEVDRNPFEEPTLSDAEKNIEDLKHKFEVINKKLMEIDKNLIENGVEEIL